MSINVQLLLINMVSLNAIKLSSYTDKYSSDQIHNYAELKRLLADIDEPLRRMDDNLKDIQDDLQGQWPIKGVNHSLTAPSIQAHRDITVDVARTIYSTSRADEAGRTFRNWAMAPL